MGVLRSQDLAGQTTGEKEAMQRKHEINLHMDHFGSLAEYK